MDDVKKERFSPVLGEARTYESDGSSRPGVPAPNHESKPVVKPYLQGSYPPPANSICALTTFATATPTTSTTTVSKGDVTPNHSTATLPRTAHQHTNNRVTSNGQETPLGNVVLAPTDSNFSGDIGDAVSKILEDYDWSKIPLANKDGTGSERRKVHVKRPMNAFMVWAQEARRKLSCSHRQVHNAELSKSLGRIWRGMTEDQKRPFIDRADHLRKKHKQEYPDYKYQPRRRKENVKTVSKGGPPPQGNPVTMQDLSVSHHYVNSVKGGNLGLSLHPLSPPNSPSTQGVVKSHPETQLGEQAVFVPECLTDTFENIDRAEMNKYLLPDQSTGSQYAVPVSHPHTPPTALQPMTTMSAMSPMNTMAVQSTNSNSLASGSSSSLTTLPSIGSRLLPPAPPVYGGSSSPYYAGGASPQPPNQSSPELIIGDISGASAGGGVSPSGSPGSPVGDYVELQPPRVPKEEPLPPLTAPKAANPFLHQNICYSTQPYPTFQYPYSYATMWH